MAAAVVWSVSASCDPGFAVGRPDAPRVTTFTFTAGLAPHNDAFLAVRVPASLTAGQWTALLGPGDHAHQIGTSDNGIVIRSGGPAAAVSFRITCGTGPASSLVVVTVPATDCRAAFEALAAADQSLGAAPAHA